MEISNLITQENNVVVSQVLAITKQDIALGNAIKALNELNNINMVEFQSYGTNYGINETIITEIRNLKDKLEKAKYGRY